MSSTSQTELRAPCLSRGLARNAPIRLAWRWLLFSRCWLNPARVRCSSAAVGRPKPRAICCGKGLDRCRSSLELAPAPLLKAGSSCLRAAEPRPQALCLGAFDAASSAARAVGLRKAQGHTMAVAAPPSNPLRGVPVRRGNFCRDPLVVVGCPRGHHRSGNGARSAGFGQRPGARDAQQVGRCNERSTVGLNRSEIRRPLGASPAAWPPRCGGRLRCR